MNAAPPGFSLGIEEEYLLVDLETRALAVDPPHAILDECRQLLEGHATTEFMRSQIEVETAVCATIGEARKQLKHLRGTVIEVARRYGFAPIASSTHPFSKWSGQVHTDKERYNKLAEETQEVGRRLVTCGMHVHVGIEDDDLRIDLMNQMTYFLPHLLALSTSSPFWEGDDTGLASYRLSVFREMPRTGPPETFASFAEFQRTVGVLVAAGIVEDGTKIWWDIRPSWRYPTLEMRITDICPDLEEGIAIAAMYRCLLRMLWRLRGDNKRWRSYSPFLVAENRWRAQRYGMDQGLIDFGRGKMVPFADLLEEMIDLVRDDAAHFGCLNEIAHLRTILTRGTSAHRQRAAYAAAKKSGASHEDALKKVVDLIVAETAAGAELPA